MSGKNWLLAAIIITFFILHQDFWLWTAVRPLVFGFIPIGLFYHAVYTLAAVALMALAIRWAWPGHLE